MLRATIPCRLYKAVNKPVKLKTSLAYEKQTLDPIERSLSTGGYAQSQLYLRPSPFKDLKDLP